MKRKLCFFGIIAAIILFLTAIYIYVNNNKLPESDPCDFLTKGSWIYYDENIGENLVLSLNEDFSCSCNCECGEPVGNSDVYETFSYHKEDGVINLYDCDGEKYQIKILYADPDYLCLQFGTGAKTYKNKSSKIDTSVRDIAKEYVDENALVLSLLGVKDGKITVAPHDFDKDAYDNYKDYIYDLDLAKDAKTLSVSVIVEYGEKSIDVAELSDEDREYIGEFYTYGYVHFNKYGSVESIVFYGESIVE